MAIASIIRSRLLLLPLIPSILVSIFVLYHFLIDRALRKAVNNHVIILLLLCGLVLELTDVIWYIIFYATGVAASQTHAFCWAWIYFCSVGNAWCYISMGWGSIERHIIVFYPHWFRIKRKRIIYHYIPLIVCIFWPLLFYLTIFFILPCNASYVYTRRFCGVYSCVGAFPGVALVDSIANYIMPAFVTVIFSVVLIVRVLLHRYRLHGRIDWKNYRKMTVQLVSISILYMLLQLPPMTLYAAYSGGLPRTVASNYYNDTLFFSYWAIMFTPFSSMISLPHLKQKLQKLLFWRKNNAVRPMRPMVVEMNRRNGNETVTIKRAPAKPGTVKPVVEAPIPEPPITVEPVPEPHITVEPIPEPHITVEPVPEPHITVEPIPEPPITAEPIPEPPITVESVTDAPMTEAAVVIPPIRIMPFRVMGVAPLTPVEI